ncbi:zinc finger protein 708-like [Anopheles maculipalpis]|uniref:zinc finger protein 708-like n=1 Tax=Anopheles maculipalpis TaxID=1496333 RepID=UPI00215909D2|nr:zinc finger protein 708-like [Anopheles maculipalpis]
MNLREISTDNTAENKDQRLESYVPFPQPNETSKPPVDAYQSQDSDNPPRCTILCKICGKTFLDQYFLRRHQLVHSKLKPFQCDKCLKSFAQKNNLVKHMLVHLRVKNFQCSLCPMKFVQKENLQAHVKNIHPALDDPLLQSRYVCQKCPSVFKTSGRLQAHRARIHGEMVIFDQCLKPSTSARKKEQHTAAASAEQDPVLNGEIVHRIIKSRRTEHMKGRTDKRQFVCDVCEAAFTKSAYLTQHRISHTGIKPHRCNICNKTFTSKQSYGTHRKLHAKTLRLFNCDKCQETFNRFASLKRHQLMVHCEQQHYFRCPYCEKKLRWLQNARTHIKTFHSKASSADDEELLEPVKERVSGN